MYKYDYLIVGSGLFGSVFAYLAKKKWQTLSCYRQTFSYWREYLYFRN